MVRTQIQLTEEQAERLRRLAAARGVSMAALVREGVDRILAADEVDAVRRRALALVGAFHGRETDVTEHHDRYLADAYEGR